MAELLLGEKRPTDYGSRYSGVVKVEDREIPVTLREPPEDQISGSAYVFATGWLGEKASMRVPAHEAVRAGHTALTFGYTNRWLHEALGQNARDLAAVIDALPGGLDRSVVALSMSGRLLTQALTHTKSALVSGTLVASAGYINGEDHSIREIVEHFGAAGAESLGMFVRSPRQALYVGGTTVRNCVQRGLAVAAEFGELIHGTEHEALRLLKEAPGAPHLRFMYGEGDGLLPAEAQQESIEGLPFDEVEPYEGGHLALVHDPALSRRIFALDEPLLARQAAQPVAA